MTEHDLAPLAKAGNRAAVNELLRRTAPALRAIVNRHLRRRPTAHDVREDAHAEAMVRAWGAIPTWDPALGSLATYVKRWLLQDVKDLACSLGGAVHVPRGADNTGYREHAAMGTRRPRSMDAPAVNDFDGDPLVETLTGRAVDPATTHDAARVLSLVEPRAAAVLWRRACGDTWDEIAADMGTAKQAAEEMGSNATAVIRRRLERAIPADATPEDTILHMLRQGPTRARDIYHALAAHPRKHVERLLIRLREDGQIAILNRSGVHVTYALAESAKAA